MVPGIVYVLGLFAILNYGLKYRLYMQYIKHGRRTEIADRFDIDFDDVESYPAAVFEEYVEQKKIEAQLKVKEEQIKKVESRFHKYAEKRVSNLAQKRRNRGLSIDGANAEKIMPVKRTPRPKSAEAKSS